VFPRADGTFDDPREVLRRFHKILDKAGVRKCRFHDLRHTFASILLNEGESMKVIQELLGHSTITTTMDIYSHVAKQTKKNSIELLEKAVSQG
jgi:integrase